jgi:hypothetical protein
MGRGGGTRASVALVLAWSGRMASRQGPHCKAITTTPNRQKSKIPETDLTRSPVVWAFVATAGFQPAATTINQTHSTGLGRRGATDRGI